MDGYIDGGVFANSPGMIALGQTQDTRNTEKAPALNEIRLLALGTGRSLNRIEEANRIGGFGSGHGRCCN